MNGNDSVDQNFRPILKISKGLGKKEEEEEEVEEVVEFECFLQI